MIRPLRSFYIAKLELTSCRRASIWVVQVAGHCCRARQSRDDIERSRSRRGRRRISAVRLSRLQDRRDMSIDSCLWVEEKNV